METNFLSILASRTVGDVLGLSFHPVLQVVAFYHCAFKKAIVKW
ncbi:MAG: hypothetical protein AB7S66_05185 [Sphaerochaeta sp.]